MITLMIAYNGLSLECFVMILKRFVITLDDVKELEAICHETSLSAEVHWITFAHLVVDIETGTKQRGPCLQVYTIRSV